MNLIVKSDPSVKESYSDLEISLFDYYDKQISLGRNNDLLYIFRYIDNDMTSSKEPLEKYFDGGKVTKYGYDMVIKRCIKL